MRGDPVTGSNRDWSWFGCTIDISTVTSSISRVTELSSPAKSLRSQTCRSVFKRTSQVRPLYIVASSRHLSLLVTHVGEGGGCRGHGERYILASSHARAVEEKEEGRKERKREKKRKRNGKERKNGAGEAG